MDLHPLIQQDVGKFTFLLNPIFEKDLIGAGTWEGSYSAQALYHWSADYSAGLEFYGDVGEFKHMPQVREEGHYVMPVINWKGLSFGPAWDSPADPPPIVVQSKFQLSAEHDESD